MDIDFYKLQIAGNDFILVNYASDIIPAQEDLRIIARHLCRRDYGIGGNGLIAVKEISSDGITAFFIDPSGTEAETTSDAALCLSRFIFDSGLIGKDDFSLKINKTVHKIGIVDSSNFRLSLGIPMTDDGLQLIEHPDKDYIKIIRADGRDYPASEIFLQKYGLVIFIEAVGTSVMKDIADSIMKSSDADPSSRLIFATVNGRDELDVHIRNSRGDDFTSSCAIAAAASVVNGFLERNATIIHKNGEFYFQWLQPSNEIFMTGSAEYVFSGSIFLDL